MECPECFQNFDELLCLPKALPCGHTFCLQCLENVDKCFVDRQVFSDVPTDLPVNFNVLAVIRSLPSTHPRGLHIWCLQCNQKALQCCLELDHKICSQKKHWCNQILKELQDEKKLEILLKRLDEADQDTLLEAKQLLSGQIAPFELLLQGAGARWHTRVDVGEDSEEKNIDLLRRILVSLRLAGVLPKELLKKPIDESQNASTDKIAEVDPDTILDLTNLSSERDQSEVEDEKKELMASEQLMKVKKITGLYCDRDEAWSLQLLKHLAPQLEGLHLQRYNLKHLEVVQSMPKLRWLVLENIQEDMQKCKDDYVLPPLEHGGGVEVLWTNLTDHDHETLIEQLLKSHQHSVQVLRVGLYFWFAHGRDLSIFDNLEFPVLKRLFYSTGYCGDNCCEKMRGLRKKYIGRSIVCIDCGRTDTFDQ